MEAEVIVALIGAGVSLVVALGAARSSARLADRQTAAQLVIEQLRREQDERTTAQAVLRRFRDPLLEAANDLGHRVNQIRHGEFLVYLDRRHGRRDLALDSTLYRVASYFATLEDLYSHVNHLRFECEEDTRMAADAIAAVGRTFATDRYDRKDGFASSRFMIWREEQRAMGETLRGVRDDGTTTRVGFTEFTQRRAGDARRWFARLAEDLEHGSAASSERLAAVQVRLAELVRVLDEERRFFRPDGTYAAPWLQRAMEETPVTGGLPLDLGTGSGR